MENPLLGANRKAKRIKSLLEHKWRSVAPANASPQPPFIQPLVFLSDPTSGWTSRADARMHVCGRDGSPVVDGGALLGHRRRHRQIGAAGGRQPPIPPAQHPHHRRPWPRRSKPSASRSRTAPAGSGPGCCASTRSPSAPASRTSSPTTSSVKGRHPPHPHLLPPARHVRRAGPVPAGRGRAGVPGHRAPGPPPRGEGPGPARHRSRLRGRVPVRSQGLAPRPLAGTSIRDASLDDRSSVLRQLAETLQAVHRRKVTHRALSPGSVLVRPGRDGEDRPGWCWSPTSRWPAATTPARALQVRPTGRARGSGCRPRRRATSTCSPTRPPCCYQAPELFTDDEPDGVSLDVFCFGALAFHVLSGRPPGDSRRGRAPDPRRTPTGCSSPPSVPGVAERAPRAGATGPPAHSCPTGCRRSTTCCWPRPRRGGADRPGHGQHRSRAPRCRRSTRSTPRGDLLGDGAVVNAGSAGGRPPWPCSSTGRPESPARRGRLQGGARRRRRGPPARRGPDPRQGSRHPGIVELFDQIDVWAVGRCWWRPLAGSQSLADELRRNGTPGIEFLQRWGVDLLDALRYLETTGRSHRDIKPDNLGVTEVGPNREQHLVLFDFSLAGAPSSDISGRHASLPRPVPRTERPRPWDLAAERYAAAVTLYEMATGETPQWGDGRSDPAFTTSEVTLDTVLFDPAVREPLGTLLRHGVSPRPRGPIRQCRGDGHSLEPGVRGPRHTGGRAQPHERRRGGGRGADRRGRRRSRRHWRSTTRSRRSVPRAG